MKKLITTFLTITVCLIFSGLLWAGESSNQTVNLQVDPINEIAFDRPSVNLVII
jgi:hypothetical protein